MSGHTWIVAASLLLSMLITGLDAQANNCVWTPYPGTLIYGGTPVSSANSLAACQAACVGSCAGVDWAQNNAAGSQCFLQQKKTDKVNNVAGVDHYDYDCTNSGGSGGCSFSQPFTNTNIYGGAANPASSLQACLTACQLNTSCQGIDWAPGNSAGQQCFLLSTTSGKNPNAVGVTHYDYFCNGTAGGTTLVPPPPPPSNVCEFAAAYVTDTSSVGGYNVPEVSVLLCTFTCYAISSCLGYDISPTTGCWFHFNATAYRQRYYQQSVTQVGLRRCPEQGIESCTPAYSNGVLTDACASLCIPKFTTWQNTAGSGGQVVNTAGFRNATSCLEYCFLQSSCVGVDYSEQPGSPSVCTVYTQLSPSNNVVKAFVTQYRLESRCSQNCSTYWEYNDNIRSRLYMPTVLTNVFTQADCLRTCRVSPTCEAYQFTKSGPGSPSCSIANSVFEFSGVNDSTVTTGIYREVCVNTAPLPPTPPGSGSGGGCSFSQPFTNTNIYGGAANPASTLPACMAACQLNTSCQGIDWAPSNSAGQQCFLLSTTSGKNPNAVGVTHYDYFCNGSGSGGGGATTLPGSQLSSTTIVPTNCWDVYNNTLIYGGTQNPATSLNDCYTACRTLGRPSCLSVDWSRISAVGSQCFLLSTQMGKVQAQGVDHYDLRSNC